MDDDRHYFNLDSKCLRYIVGDEINKRSLCTNICIDTYIISIMIILCIYSSIIIIYITNIILLH